MKPFLGIDITENKKNEEMNGKEFIVAEPSLVYANELDESVDSAHELIEKAKMPLPFRIVQGICGFVALFGVFGVIRFIVEGNTLKMGYENAPWLFWVSAICFVAWVVLYIVSHKKMKSVIESEETELFTSKIETLADNIYAELEVPTSAPDVDVLSVKYKIKNDAVKPVTGTWESTLFNNLEYKVFADSENLCIADLRGKYAIPLSELRAIRTINKSISVPDWNKETPANKGEYKQYKLNIDTENDLIHFKTYYILEFEHYGETWGIYIPKYELPIFEELSGLRAEEV